MVHKLYSDEWFRFFLIVSETSFTHLYRFDFIVYGYTLRICRRVEPIERFCRHPSSRSLPHSLSTHPYFEPHLLFRPTQGSQHYFRINPRRPAADTLNSLSQSRSNGGKLLSWATMGSFVVKDWSTFGLTFTASFEPSTSAPSLSEPIALPRLNLQANVVYMLTLSAQDL